MQLESSRYHDWNDHLHSVSQGNGAITAQRRQSPSQETGFIFVGCKVSGGRPWGDYSRVAFALCYMSNVIMPQGWDDWGSSSKQRTVFYGEYKCYGPGARSSKRMQWSYGLTTQEVAPYLGWGVIGGPSWILSANYARIKRISTMISNNFHGVETARRMVVVSS